MSDSALPIDSVLEQLRTALTDNDAVVLEAPPGAGKTTRVPLDLLSLDCLKHGKLVMLEPRRLAARAAAERMASLLGEKPGQTVGYRIRHESRVGPQTRIEVVTEGVLLRQLQSDPGLSGVALVIFDEFHERSLDADIGLGLSLLGRDLFREGYPLRLLVMSATLDGAAVSKLLDDAPVVRAKGRSFAVDVRYGSAWTPRDDCVERVVACVTDAIRDETGSVLAFLPGQREIRDTERRLARILEQRDVSDVRICPLYGDLSLAEQRNAIAPARDGERKVVLATAIAQTSLTIEGVRVVIDSGLERVPAFDPRTGMSRLGTVRASRAASDQRAGRAGRVEPGVCYRLWSEEQQRQLVAFSPPEIHNADLAPMLLQLLVFGVDDPADLRLLDAPPPGALAQARDLLESLGAIEGLVDGGVRLTPHGAAMAALPAHPRLGHMVLVGKSAGCGRLACDVAALLSSRDPVRGAGADIVLRLNALRQGGRDIGRRFRDEITRISTQLGRAAGIKNDPANVSDVTRWTGFLVAMAWPDRVARQRDAEPTVYQLSGGRAAALREDDPLLTSQWLAVAESGGTTGRSTDLIFLAARVDESAFENELAPLVTETEAVSWTAGADQMTAERQRCIGGLVVFRAPLAKPSDDARRIAVVEFVRKNGMGLFNLTDDFVGWRQRIGFLREVDSSTGEESEWPDFSDQALLDDTAGWLGPYLHEVRHVSHLKRLDLKAMLQTCLPWPLPQRLDERAPIALTVPSGSSIRVDYSTSPPVLAVRLQEMFGATTTPVVAGHVAVVVHLLSPAQRPIQVTQDLAGFWEGSYAEVKKEMRGQYPKHYWPDDPLMAQPSRRSTQKPRK